jgi:hypothetical protein
MASQVVFAHAAIPGRRFLWWRDRMTKRVCTLLAAAFILGSISFSPLPQRTDCQALLDSQMAQCVGLGASAIEIAEVMPWRSILSV